MTFFEGVKLGFKSYSKAFTLLFSTKLWLFLLFPLALNIILFLGGIEVVDTVINYVKINVFDWTNLENADFFLSDYLKGFLTGFIYVIFKFLFFFVFSYFGGYIIIIILSPVLAMLSEKTEYHLTKKSYNLDIQQLFRDIIRGILIAFRNLGFELAIVLGFLILGLIPVIGWITTLLSPIVLLFVSSYFYGFAFMDYSSERRKLKILESISLIKKNKGVAIANGLIFSISLMLPFCGTFIAGFFAIVAVVAATISMEEVFDNKKELSLQK